MNPEILILIAMTITIVFVVGFMLYERYINVKTTKYDAYMEVFPVLTSGTNALGKGRLLGYQYATPDQIDKALANGLRVPGVTSDVYVAFGETTGSTLSMYPAFYKAKDGDFDTELNINWPVKSATVDNKRHTFLAFLYGYKPAEKYADKAMTMLDEDLSSPQKILPFSSGRWNTPSPENGNVNGGKEVLLVLIEDLSTNNSFSDDVEKTKDYLKKSGFEMANLEQYHWAVSQGLAEGLKPSDYTNAFFTDLDMHGCFVPITQYVPWQNMPSTPKDKNGVDVLKYITPKTKCIVNISRVPSEPTSQVGYGKIYAVWADRKTFNPDWTYTSPYEKGPQKVNWIVLPFNSDKKSIYDK